MASICILKSVGKPSRLLLLGVAAVLVLIALPAAAQPGLTLPPPGDNQKTVVTQYMGQVAVMLTYNSPDVTSPAGEDRTGKIWGELVPYGMANLGFGTAAESPWRTGANENTTIEFSHDVLVEGQKLAAGVYGLHTIPGEDEWTFIFSDNSSSWGSFFYDPAEDALRVTARPEKAPFAEWLTFEFPDRQWDSTVVALHWENLRVPFRVEVPNPVDLYVATIENELRNSPGFSWNNWSAAANFVLTRDDEGEHLEKALQWADRAVTAPFIGQANWQTLSTKAQVLERLGRTDEAKETMQAALEHGATTAGQIHQYARQLIGQGRGADAVETAKFAHQRFAGAWPTEVTLVRALSAVGDYEAAAEHAHVALEQAPNDPNKQNLQTMIEQLEQGVDVN